MKRIFISILTLALVAALISPHVAYAQDKTTEVDLEALGATLKAAIASGEMTEAAASAEYEKAAGKLKGAKTNKGKEDKNWKAPAINGLPCSPSVPDGVDPTDGVSFDPDYQNLPF